ncbi:MAG: DUF4252 domain-containing protein [Melioribacteraceae bacterium]|nr:DUF4252 domain-containing protein [Melioribacteraceae bacterium]MCF8265101.1 DUF4252 domain-containing protein [Melioribacteraceae bacterium]MCF8413220.1 DUF4252 domain-containing protein [Melioribacteraceae bacterium]MCF8431187.1 DUF4252 domain-containing protein [Melioribacteraceae bacterium]
MKLRILAILAIFTFAAMININAQQNDYSNEPGYVNFGNLDLADENGSVAEVILEAKLLRMVSKMAKGEDEELANLIAGLKLIVVNSFEVSANNKDKVVDRINSIDKDLNKKSWDRIVRIKGKEENVNIYIKTTPEETIAGLVVAAMDENDQATFVNIVGDIDLETIGRLSDKFDIPNLEKINGGKNDKDED